MKATKLIHRKRPQAENAFYEFIIWRVSESVPGSDHNFKYRLAYVVNNECVLRYYNESGKGDHRHFGDIQSAYLFTTLEQLIADFRNDIERWHHENRNP